MKMAKNKYFIIFLCVCVCITAFFIARRDRKITAEYPSVYWTNNDAEQNELLGSVSFDGVLTSEQFDGEIILNFSERIVLANAYASLTDGVGTLTYGSIEDGVPNIQLFGILVCNDALTQFSILLQDPLSSKWDSASTEVISGPTNTREEALALLSDLTEHDDWLSPAVWH